MYFRFFKRFHIRKYLILGFIFGLCFAFLATVIAVYEQKASWVEVHLTNPILWIVDTAPIVLAAIFYYIGLKHEQILYLNEKLMEKIKRDEKELYETKEALVHSSRLSAIGEMSAGIAHEINNPLSVIHGHLTRMQKLLEKEDLDKEKLRLSIEKQLKSLSRIQKIISSLKKSSKDGENDPYELFDLKSMVSEALEFGISRLKNHNIDFKVEFLKEDIQMEGQFVQLTQVIINLINNAHDAIVNFEGEKWVRLIVDATFDKVIIKVRDCGKGIPQEIASKILEPFFTTKPVGEGTGLGLSLCNGIIAKHGGHLKINHECPNTEFVIEIPRYQTSQHSQKIA